jgi:hypothetical protein
LNSFTPFPIAGLEIDSCCVRAALSSGAIGKTLDVGEDDMSATHSAAPKPMGSRSFPTRYLPIIKVLILMREVPHHI